jgi:hypothetical protein
MALATLVSCEYRKFIDKLRRHPDGLEEYNRKNVKKRLEFLADGGDICELEDYESFTEEITDNERYMLLAADADINFIESPDPGRCLLFLASPVCTALIIGEYELAERLLEYYPLEKMEPIKIFDETQMIIVMDSDNPYNEEMHCIMVESFLAELWEKIGDKIRPFWDSLENSKLEIVRDENRVPPWRKGIIQLPTLFGAYRHNRVYMEYKEAGRPRDAFETDLIIDTKYDGSKLLEYLKKLSEYSTGLFKHYIRDCSFEFGQLTPDTEFRLKLAIQRLAVSCFDGDEDSLVELMRDDCLKFELPRYQLGILNPNKEVLFKHIKYCGKYYKTDKKLRHAFLDYMIRYFVDRSCDWAELEKYAGEFFDEDFPVMDYAVSRGQYVNCMEYTHVYTRLAKGRHIYHVSPDREIDAKYMISMFSMLDEKPKNVNPSWILSSQFSDYQKRLYDMIFWLEDMERVEIDIPDGSLSYGWRDLDFVDIRADKSILKTGDVLLPFLDIDDMYFYLLAFIWNKICQTGDAELFTQAYKKGFIPKSQIEFSLEKYGNDEFKWNKSLVPVMLGVAG